MQRRHDRTRDGALAAKMMRRPGVAQCRLWKDFLLPLARPQTETPISGKAAIRPACAAELRPTAIAAEMYGVAFEGSVNMFGRHWARAS